jgi:LysR family transcriptional regulator, hca operon transcriptional activator
VHGIELTAAGRAFLDHARLALTQAEAAKEAARRAAKPAKPFALGFLTGREINWLPEAMRILHDELPNIELTVSSQNSPDLAEALMRGRLDAAFMRPEERADELVYRRVITEPFVVVLPSDHRLATHDAIELREIVGRNIHHTVEDGPDFARCDRGLPEAVRAGYHSGSRSGQHYPCGVHDRVDRRRSAAARLPK